jgi:glycosyltransferase involved in cell wall biosynthesis
MDVSVVVPLYNEEESLKELFLWIQSVALNNDFSFEVWFVDDGSKDSSWQVITQLQQKHPEAKGIRFSRNYGKSAALNVGFQHANGDVVITMDADLQDSPDEIPELRRLIVEDGFDLISGWKKKRYDPISKTIPTKIYNWATRVMSGIYLHDFNCGLKAYRQDVIKSIEVYGEMHRYIPVIAKQAGFQKIGEKVVQHRERKYGKTKFGLERFINGPLDLLSIVFVSRFGKKPMHLFGSVGTFMFLIGFVLALYLGVEKLAFLAQGVKARLITEQPFFYIALTCMILGTQLFLAGFLGELISRSSADRNHYLIKEKFD